MNSTDDTVAIAIGLMRKAHSLLPGDEVGAAARALAAAIELTVEEHQMCPSDEIEPDTACLVAGIPLEGRCAV